MLKLFQHPLNISFACLRDEDKKAWVSIIVGAGCGCIAIPYVIWLRKKMFA